VERFGARVNMCLKEDFKRLEHVLTKDEKKHLHKYGPSSAQRRIT
jgi:hypothetical protein